MAEPDSVWISFEEMPTNPGRKTKIWHVRAKDGNHLLGTVKWHGAWRQYCFFPLGDTLWNAACLDDLTAFIRRRMTEHRAAKKS